jgi:hypothetical protein
VDKAQRRQLIREPNTEIRLGTMQIHGSWRPLFLDASIVALETTKVKPTSGGPISFLDSRPRNYLVGDTAACRADGDSVRRAVRSKGSRSVGVYAFR